MNTEKWAFALRGLLCLVFVKPAQEIGQYKIEIMNKLLIERYRTPNYKSIIEITPKNKNYLVFKKIDTILKRENKQWNWFFKRLDISIPTLKTYFAGKENISLKSVEAIAEVLRPYIESPRTIMDNEFPILTLGIEFKLNISYLMNRYGITQSEIVVNTDFDRGGISRLARGKMSRVSPVRLIELYEYFKTRGIPLTSTLDLIYFPNWDEVPNHFIQQKPRGNQVYKFHSSLRRL